MQRESFAFCCLSEPPGFSKSSYWILKDLFFISSILNSDIVHDGFTGYCLRVYILLGIGWINTFIFFKKRNFYKFWDILFLCSKFWSKPKIILEQTFLPVVVILSGPPSNRLVLYGLFVSEGAKAFSLCLLGIFCPFSQSPYATGGRYFSAYFIICCYSQFCIVMNGAELFICFYHISLLAFSNISSSVISNCYLLQCF